MARPAKGKTLTSLAGKLGLIRREVQQVMRRLQREIARRERELADLKAEYGQAADLLRGKAPAPPPPAKPSARRRARPVDWQKVYASLPAVFRLDALLKHPVAGKRPKPHLYALVSRWKKEGRLAAAAGGGYRKVVARAKSKAVRAKRPPAPKPVPAGESAAKADS
jgi:hypothetical protein